MFCAAALCLISFVNVAQHKLRLLWHAGLLDILQGPHLGSSLQLNAIVCLVSKCFGCLMRWMSAHNSDRLGVAVSGAAPEDSRHCLATYCLGRTTSFSLGFDGM